MQFEGLSWEEHPERIHLFGWSVQDILEIPTPKPIQ